MTTLKDLAAAVQRRDSADVDVRYLERQIKRMAAELSTLRKDRLKAIAKKERAQAAIDRAYKRAPHLMQQGEEL